MSEVRDVELTYVLTSWLLAVQPDLGCSACCMRAATSCQPFQPPCRRHGTAARPASPSGTAACG